MEISELTSTATPRSNPEDRWKRPTFWLLVLSPLLYAGVSQLLGQDVDWDLQNYHYFDSYWLLVNHMHDVMPAQLQTYLSPLLDIPFYFAAQDLPPRLTVSLLAIVQGTAFPLLYLINRHFTCRRSIALALAGLGMFTAGALGEVGTIFGDTLVAPLFFLAILSSLHWFDATRSPTPNGFGPAAFIVIACCVAGLAAGLKLAELPIALGIALAFPLVGGNAMQRARKAISASGALILGILVSYGWWGYELATRYGNPALPYMNQVFHSPYAPPTPNSGTHLGILEIPLEPILWSLNPISVGGVSFLEASMPIAEVLLVALLAVATIRAVMRRQPIKVFDNDKQRYLIAVVVIAYLSWSLLFDMYRFLIPLEMLSFTVIFICLQAISAQISWKPLVNIGTVALALLCIVSEQPLNLGRAAWSPRSFSTSIPSSLRNQPAAFLMLGTNPDAFVVPSFPKQDFFAQIEGNLPPTPYLRGVIEKDVSGYRDAYTIWEGPALPTLAAFTDVSQDHVEVYGFQIDWRACDQFAAHVGAVPETFHACKLKKIDPSTVPPSTVVLHPVGGATIEGDEYLAATAFDPVGLHKVAFSITGNGRTVTTRAALSLVGWLGDWKTTAVPNGLYTVRCVAYGDNGLVGVSRGVIVDVRNHGRDPART